MNAIRTETAGLSGQYRKLSQPLRHLNEGDYIVVETARNQLLFISNSQVLFKSACLTGTGREFIDPVDGRAWVFDTPRGEFCITSKVRDLVWRQRNSTVIERYKGSFSKCENRFEDGIVEDYALGFGSGYSIHGMLYAKSIGKSVTHGCVRLGDKELQALFTRTRVGTPLLIF